MTRKQRAYATITGSETQEEEKITKMKACATWVTFPEHLCRGTAYTALARTFALASLFGVSLWTTPLQQCEVLSSIVVSSSLRPMTSVLILRGRPITFHRLGGAGSGRRLSRTTPPGALARDA